MKQNAIQRENSNFSSSPDSDSEQQQQLLDLLLSFREIGPGDLPLAPLPPATSKSKEKSTMNGHEPPKETKTLNGKGKRHVPANKKDSESPYKILVTTDLKTKSKLKAKRLQKGGPQLNYANLDWDLSTAGKPQYYKKNENGKIEGNSESEKIRFQKTLSLTNDTSILRGRRSLLDKRPRQKQQKKVLGTYSRGQKQLQPKVFACHLESCGKVFTDRASLKKHLTVHGDKLFQCSFANCGKKFLDNAKLKRHMLVHTGEKPYECPLCGKKFSLDFNLKTHQRIHTGEKPFSCSFKNCHKRFNQKSNLHAHMLTHHLQDANPDFAQQIQNEQLGMQEQFPHFDFSNMLSAVNDKSKLSKLEKREQEISKLIQKSGGKLFFSVRLEKQLNKEDGFMNSEDFELQKQYLESLWSFKGPLFKISLKPRKVCLVHSALLDKEKQLSKRIRSPEEYKKKNHQNYNIDEQDDQDEEDKTISEDITLREQEESEMQDEESNKEDV